MPMKNNDVNWYAVKAERNSIKKWRYMFTTYSAIQKSIRLLINKAQSKIS
jgi:hypothetical protein